MFEVDGVSVHLVLPVVVREFLRAALLPIFVCAVCVVCGTANAQVPSTAPSTQIQSSGKLATSAAADYSNKYEVYGGLNFMNGQAGQNLPKRYNLGGGEVMATYWLGKKFGVAADYRIDAGTTPIFPNPFYNRVLVYQNIFMGGVQYRGPHNRYAAIDYHALVGASHGTFDHAFQNYPGGSPITATDAGLYSNRTSPFAAAGGSVDFNVSNKVAVRLQPDMTFEHFGTETRYFFAISGGLVYRIGRR